MAPIIIFILLAIIGNRSQGAEVKVIYNERTQRPVYFITPEDTEEEKQKMDCLNSARPYVVLSARDKKVLERLINQKHDKLVDPNLELP